MNTKSISGWKLTAPIALGAALLLAVSFWTPQAAADDGAAGSPALTSKAAPQPANVETPEIADPGKVSPLPARPQPAPPAKSGSDPHIQPGSDFPRVETSPAFMYVRTSIANRDFNCAGGGGTLAYNFTNWLGLAADLGGCKYIGQTLSVGNKLDGNLFTFLFGPRFTYRSESRVQPFGEVNFGGARVSLSCSSTATGCNNATNGSTFTKTAFALTVGGGFDVKVNKKFAIRVVQAEYLYTRFGDGCPLAVCTNNNNQNSFRLKSGVVFGFGAKPIAVNRPPTASCSADASSIVQGSGGSVPLRANASDPDGDTLTYSWSANGGQVDGSGPTARWTPGNAAPGSYTITARVDDGHGGTASCSANVTVEPRPLRPPTVACSVDRNSVLPGEVVNVTANGSSPEGFPLDYSWHSSGGRVSGSGSRVQLDTSGLAPGDYNVTARATDGHGGAADCAAGVHVKAPPPKPQPVKLGECIFKPGSTKVDNQCSMLLDDAVVRLQNDPNSTLILIGYADPAKEKKGKLAETRAANARKYASQGKGKGTGRVDAGRLNTRAEAGVAGADTANRRVEVIWVPQGASY